MNKKEVEREGHKKKAKGNGHECLAGHHLNSLVDVGSSTSRVPESPQHQTTRLFYLYRHVDRLTIFEPLFFLFSFAVFVSLCLTCLLCVARNQVRGVHAGLQPRVREPQHHLQGKLHTTVPVVQECYFGGGQGRHWQNSNCVSHFLLHSVYSMQPWKRSLSKPALVTPNIIEGNNMLLLSQFTAVAVFFQARVLRY